MSSSCRSKQNENKREGSLKKHLLLAAGRPWGEAASRGPGFAAHLWAPLSFGGPRVPRLTWGQQRSLTGASVRADELRLPEESFLNTGINTRVRCYYWLLFVQQTYLEDAMK